MVGDIRRIGCSMPASLDGGGTRERELPGGTPVIHPGDPDLRATAAYPGWSETMKVRRFAIADASMERSPGQKADVFVGNLVDERHGGPITIGMVVLEGRLSVSTDAGTVTAGPGEIVYMPKGEAVTIRSHEEGAVTAYVTHPHWRAAHA